jgi:hypothetical protein
MRGILIQRVRTLKVEAREPLGKAAAENATLDPLDKERMSKVNLNTAKAVKEKVEAEAIMAELNGTDAETQLDYLSVATKGLGKVYS